MPRRGTQAKKRPATWVEGMAPGNRSRVLRSRQGTALGNGPEWLQRAVGADVPDWASHGFRTLEPSFEALKMRMGSRIRIVCWADCGGLGAELIALEGLAARLEEHLKMALEIVPYAFCDSSVPAQKFATLNHKPRHIINDMMQRDFEARTFRCQTCGVDHDVPSRGVDLYVCGFPCGPWSARGKQLRFGDADGDKCWQAISSIKNMTPCLFALENVIRLDSKSDGNTETDLDQIVRAMTDELGDLYTIVVLSGLDPSKAGYPVRKKSILVLGARTDQESASGLHSSAGALLDNSMPVLVNYRQLLGLTTNDTIP